MVSMIPEVFMQELQEPDLHLGPREIAEGEQCITRQKQLISNLASSGRSTARAEALLATMEDSLRQIRRLVR
jgi:hypothetical protein